MEETGNGKMIVITGGKVNDANALVDRIANSQPHIILRMLFIIKLKICLKANSTK